jgi:hypothetical protein
VGAGRGHRRTSGAALALSLAWLAGCGVPNAKYLELESAFDGAAATRDRAQADLDACRAEAAQNAAAAANVAALDTAVAALGATLGGVPIGSGFALDPSRWFADGTAELSKDSPIELLARALAGLPRSELVWSISAGPVPPTREHPTPWHLASDRAAAFGAALVAAGVPMDRLRIEVSEGPGRLSFNARVPEAR